jgi:hypothetical protein
VSTLRVGLIHLGRFYTILPYPILSISGNDTYLVVVTSARRTAARTDGSAQTYKWGDITIPQVTSYKYLGVIMNNTNTWDEHFEARLRSGTKAAAAHHKVLTQVRLPTHLRKGTITTIVQPVVTYAAQGALIGPKIDHRLVQHSPQSQFWNLLNHPVYTYPT